MTDAEDLLADWTSLRWRSDLACSTDSRDAIFERSMQPRHRDRLEQPRGRRRLLSVAVLLVLTGGLAGLVVGLQPSTGPGRESRNVMVSENLGACVPNAEGSPQALFADTVVRLGSDSYSAAFGGAVLSPCSVTDVYAVTASVQYGGLVAMVRRDSHGYPYKIIAVNYSLIQLKSAAATAAGRSVWRQNGLRIVVAVPNVGTSRVDLTVAPLAPTSGTSLAADLKAAKKAARQVLGRLTGTVRISTKESAQLTPAVTPAQGSRGT